jgi:hypothetical protein
MECEVCGRPLRRNNRTGFCYAHCRTKKRRSLEIVKRKCLKCDEEFSAMGRLNRICPICNEKNREFVDPSRYQTTLRSLWAGPG